jgi:Uncharacterised nucleotidyltransferase
MTDDAAADPAMSDCAAEALVALAAYGLAGTVTEFPAQPLADMDWSMVARHVCRQRLSGLMMAAIHDGALPVTAEQRAQAAAFDSRVVARCLHLEGQLLRVVRNLSRAGVPIRVLKGSAVAHLDYPDPRLRPFIDVDLLVRSADFDTAATLLRGAGLSRVYPEPRPGFDRRFGKGGNFRGPDGTSVDLHRTFVMGPYGLRIRLDDLWDAPDPFVAGGRELHAMSIEARLLHACYHAVLGDWPRRLLPHRDIAQILLYGRVSESRLFELSLRWRGEALLAMGITGAWDLLRITDDHPVARWARRQEIPAAEWRLVGLYSHDRHNYAAKSLAAVRSIHGMRHKVSFLRALALPKRHYILDRHASAGTRLLSGLRQIRAQPRS